MFLVLYGGKLGKGSHSHFFELGGCKHYYKMCVQYTSPNSLFPH
jgi:hypothetical protein